MADFFILLCVDMITFVDVEEARERIQNQIYLSPFPYSETISRLTGNRVFFKLENLQMTGSFKERGALNRLLTLTPDEAKRGVIAASAGNHGMAVAFHSQRLKIAATIVMPLHAPLIKVSRVRHYGAQTVLHGTDYDTAFVEAQRLAQEKGLTLIHGFNDPWVVAGQGTIGLELYEQNPDLNAVVVPVGGGGLIARHRSRAQDAQSEDSYHRRASGSRSIHESRFRKREADSSSTRHDHSGWYRRP